MARVQLALNVAHLDQAIAFYSKLFGAQPAKVRPGYANFALADPPLKLVLIEDPDKAPGSLNHLGVEVASPEEVMAARGRLAAAGLPTTVEESTTCCYAVQDKVWAHGGPGDQPWEFYTVLADATISEAKPDAVEATACCGTEPVPLSASTTAAPCC